MKTDELLPCPFCGSEAELINGNLVMYLSNENICRVVCKNEHCFLNNGVNVYYPCEEDAIKEWNKRK